MATKDKKEVLAPYKTPEPREDRRQRLGRLPQRIGLAIPLLDEPPLGHLQALVLQEIGNWEHGASGVMVVEELSLECGVWIDRSQVYDAIRRLVKAGYLEACGTRKSEIGGPPEKIYKTTLAGRGALALTHDHYLEVAHAIRKNILTIYPGNKLPGWDEKPWVYEVKEEPQSKAPSKKRARRNAK